MSEINSVQVQRQNLFFIKLVFEPKSQKKLLNFTVYGFFVGKKQIFSNLLRDCASALSISSGKKIGYHGASKRDNVKTQTQIFPCT